MYSNRIFMAGALMLLGACSPAPVRQHPVSVATAVAAPTPLAAPVAAVPVPPRPAPPPVVVETPPAPLPAMPAAVVPTQAPLPQPVAHRAIAKIRMPEKSEVPAKIASTAASLQISGHVELKGANGQHVAAGEQADTLVYFVPDKGSTPIKPGNFTVYTHNRDFSPEAIAVPEGSTVTFVNLDDVRHNVFSVTPGAAFNLGYQGAGEKASHVFGHAGIVLVSCMVHHAMELDMLVIPQAHVGKVAADGSFTLRGLPAGPGTLHFWNPRAQPASQSLTLPLATAVTQKLLATRSRMTTQLNTGDNP